MDFFYRKIIKEKSREYFVTFDLVYLSKYIQNDMIHYLKLVLSDKFVNKCMISEKTWVAKYILSAMYTHKTNNTNMKAPSISHRKRTSRNNRKRTAQPTSRGSTRRRRTITVKSAAITACGNPKLVSRIMLNPRGLRLADERFSRPR